jgi:hypothetical protein
LSFFIVSDAILVPLQVETDTQAQDDNNASQTMLEESRPDEDIDEEIVYNPNTLAEVTLPSRICQSQLFMYMTFLNGFVQIIGGHSTMPHSSFSNPPSQR